MEMMEIYIVIAVIAVAFIALLVMINRSKKKDCQSKYDAEFEKIYGQFMRNYQRGDSDFAYLQSFIISADNIMTKDVFNDYSNGIKKSVVKNYTKTREMTEMIFAGLEDKYNSLIKEDPLTTNYTALCTGILSSVIDEMRKAKTELDKTESGAGIDDGYIDNFQNKVQMLQDFSDEINASKDSYMLDGKEYGRVNKEFYDYVLSLQKSTVDAISDEISTAVSSADVAKMVSMDPHILAACVWFYAIAKPFSADNFNKAVKSYKNLHRTHLTTETFIAELYSIKQMGGKGVIRTKIQSFLGNHRNELSPVEKIAQSNESVSIDKALSTVASGLMWMQAYDGENMILEYMLEHQIQMPAKLQERLHSLSVGGGEAPSGYDVASDANKMYVDISAVSWNDEKTTGLFENLAFQDKNLTYSVAVRDEDKELLLSQGVKLPRNEVLCNKISEKCVEEYGKDVEVKLVDCVALSGAAEESMQGVLLSVNEFPQMGILTLTGAIGKKINIKFYTLFIPISQDLNVQKQQLLSLQKKTGMSITMWEAGLKDTVLLAMQKELNKPNGGIQEPGDPEPMPKEVQF